MALSLGLETKLQQKLSPQMIQRLQLAALPLTELRQKIQDEAVANPVLEVRETTPDAGTGEPDTSAYDLDREDELDEPETYEDRPGDHASYDEEASDRAQAALENTADTTESLQEHLERQLGMEKLSPDVYQAAVILAGDLDADGFLEAPPEEVLPPHLRSVGKQAAGVLSRLDPVGCAVPSWRESLLVQAEERGVKGEEAEVMDRFVHDDEALKLAAAGKSAQAASRLDTDVDEVEGLFALMKRLTLFPGRQYDTTPSPTVTPDFSITNHDGTLVLRMNDEALPSLSLDPSYVAMADTTKDPQARSYLHDRIKDAKELIDEVAFRRSNLEKLAVFLMEQQKDFFLKGSRYLKPLTQKDAAAILGVSEPTVSRLAGSKYVATDWGVIPVKSLFSSEIGGQSRTSVQEQIRTIIQQNTTGKRLSDQKIADLLGKQGIKIARRTVAKYRAELHLDSSFAR